MLTDKGEHFAFGFSKLDVMFGRRLPEQVSHSYADLVKPGVRFVRSTVRSIDASTRHVETDAGPFDADILVVALGADLHPEATPRLLECGNEFYTVAGAFALRDVLADLDGGRVVIGLTGAPFKYPPAPSETALLMHDLLTDKGVLAASEITLVMPLGAPIPPSPDTSALRIEAFADRGITWMPELLVRKLDPGRRVALLSDGMELPFDLFLGVPIHRAPAVVQDSGMAVDGWIPVNPLTLETGFPGVYAVGDVTSVGTPKAGVVAEGQAVIIAGQIIAQLRGETGAPTYDGRGICYLEAGHDQVAEVDVAFRSGERPVGGIEGPSTLLVEDKVDFGVTRVSRWFGRTWTT